MILEALESRQLLAADFLYVGDTTTDAVLKFDAGTGALIGSFVPSGTTSLNGPRGMVFHDDKLLVVNQNVGTPFNGEVLQFDAQTGTELSPLVSVSNINAPFAPRGIVVRDNVAYVADFEGLTHPRIAKYDTTNGNYLGELVPSGFAPAFRPRGLLFGPDGKLYVSVFSEATYFSADPAGYILRFNDTTSGTFDVIASNNGDGVTQAGEIAGLQNPEGLAFSPDGKLYVTTFRNISVSNQILVLDVGTKTQQDAIPMGSLYAQALLFGPGGGLYVPITGGGADIGSVRVYDVATKNFETLIAPSTLGGPLLSPFYLTFGQTDPATLSYVATTTSTAPVLSNLELTPLLVQGAETGQDPLNRSVAAVTESLIISDSDSNTLTGAAVTITDDYRPGNDSLLFDNTTDITGAWDAVAGKLTLSGGATVAQYQAALRTIRFQATGFGDPISGVRTIEFEVSDDSLSSIKATRSIRVAILRGDYLFIGDQGDLVDPTDDTVKQFDITVTPGSLVSTFVAANQLVGPRGLVFHSGNLLAVNQNVETQFNGEVLRFDGNVGTPLTPAVENTNPQAPFAPRGVVAKDGVLFVADFEGQVAPRIAKYNAETGAFLGNLSPTGFVPEFRPRGLVFGPDGMLYVSVFSEATYSSADPAGYVLRFNDINSGTFDIVASNNGDGIAQVGEISDLHNPEGIVFGPDGRLYVTTFRDNSANNPILILDVDTKTKLDAIPLGSLYAQALLFGPNDGLYVPINGGGLDRGSVRVYDVTTKNFQTLIVSADSGGKLDAPWYMTFTQTDPATLAYRPWHNFVNPLDVNGSLTVTAQDALVIINELGRRTGSMSGSQLPSSRSASRFYYDVLGDGSIMALGILRVINSLRRLDVAPPDGEQSTILPIVTSIAQGAATLGISRSTTASFTGSQAIVEPTKNRQLRVAFDQPRSTAGEGLGFSGESNLSNIFANWDNDQKESVLLCDSEIPGFDGRISSEIKASIR